MVAVIAASGVALSCGSHLPSSRSPSPTLGLPASALVLVTTLHSGPGVTGTSAVASEGACSGAATVTIDPTPRGALRLAVARFEISVIGCPPGTTITSVHIHQLPIGDRNDEWIGSDLPELVLPKGDGSFTSTNQGVPVARAEEVVARPTDFYLHFHSKNNPVGFLRGELRPR
jgi:hypothetical protein